jgi:hypothetical protein
MAWTAAQKIQAVDYCIFKLRAKMSALNFMPFNILILDKYSGKKITMGRGGLA